MTHMYRTCSMKCWYHHAPPPQTHDFLPVHSSLTCVFTACLHFLLSSVYLQCFCIFLGDCVYLDCDCVCIFGRVVHFRSVCIFGCLVYICGGVDCVVCVFTARLSLGCSDVLRRCSWNWLEPLSQFGGSIPGQGVAKSCVGP